MTRKAVSIWDIFQGEKHISELILGSDMRANNIAALVFYSARTQHAEKILGFLMSMFFAKQTQATRITNRPGNAFQVKTMYRYFWET